MEEAEARARAATARALDAEGRLGDAARQIRRLDMQAAVAEAEIAACRTAGDARDAALAELCARLEQRAAPAPAAHPDPNPKADEGLARCSPEGSADFGSAAMPEQVDGGEGMRPSSAHPPEHSVQARSLVAGDAGTSPEPAHGADLHEGQGQGQGPDTDAVDRLVGAWRGACAERDRRIAELAAQLAQARLDRLKNYSDNYHPVCPRFLPYPLSAVSCYIAAVFMLTPTLNGGTQLLGSEGSGMRCPARGSRAHVFATLFFLGVTWPPHVPGT